MVNLIPYLIDSQMPTFPRFHKPESGVHLTISNTAQLAALFLVSTWNDNASYHHHQILGSVESCQEGEQEPHGLFQGRELGQIRILTEHRDTLTVILGGIDSISPLSHHFYFIKSDPSLHSWERCVSETEMSFSDVRCLQRKWNMVFIPWALHPAIRRCPWPSEGHTRLKAPPGLGHDVFVCGGWGQLAITLEMLCPPCKEVLSYLKVSKSRLLPQVPCGSLPVNPLPAGEPLGPASLILAAHLGPHWGENNPDLIKAQETTAEPSPRQQAAWCGLSTRDIGPLPLPFSSHTSRLPHVDVWQKPSQYCKVIIH